ncbi:MAG TPA: flagellar hook basal-body protein [Dissulfurispiraceae bacterium]|nr:flagellar hook basal-body protein [Dissulfurispiraceae bacterium]
MYKGMYVAMTGSTLKMMELDNVTNNLANVSTNGFKRTSFSTRLYPITEALPQVNNAACPDARSMAFTGKYSIDPAQGVVQTTGNPLDVAINGEGFFIVDVKGERNFTRNGSFGIDKDGFLTAGNGYKVIGTDDKPIKLGKDLKAAPNIATDGSITVEGNTVGTLKMVKITDIQNLSEALYAGKVAGSAKGEVKQGSLERSNVNPLRELVVMITAQREFQTIQQMMRSFDQLTSEAVTQIAKVS